MNNLFNNSEIEAINSQISRAYFQKNKLIKDIYKEYEFYLEVIRSLLIVSVEKGIFKLHSNLSKNDSVKVSNEIGKLLERKINFFINSKLHLFTIEQLKISKNKTDLFKEFNFDGIKEFESLIDTEKDSLNVGDESLSRDLLQLNVNENNSYASEYNHYCNNDKNLSLNLDKFVQLDCFSNTPTIENRCLEKRFMNLLLNLIEEDPNNKFYSVQDLDNYKSDISTLDQKFYDLDQIENELSNLFLNLSFEINLELFNSKLINKIISEDVFKYLINKNYVMKHPYPFVISFDLNSNQKSKNIEKLPNITLLNINTVELEFKKLSILY